MNTQPYTHKEKTMTILTEQRDMGEWDSRGTVWVAWVKETPGIWETEVREDAAIEKLKKNIDVLYDLI